MKPTGLVITLLLIVNLVQSATLNAPDTLKLSKSVRTSEKRADVGLSVASSAVYSWNIPVTLGVSSTETFRVVLDTGSADLLIYTPDCAACPGTNDWDPTTDGSSQVSCGSSTVIGCQSANSAASCASDQTCSVVDRYGGGSVVTSVAFTTTVDIPNAGGSPISNTFAGAIVSISGPVLGPSGIMGFGHKGLSSAGVDPTPLSYMRANNQYQAFTLLLASDVLILGQDDRNLAGMNFVPSSGNFWSVPVQKIKANGQTLSLGSGISSLPTLIDSGTSGIFLPPNLYQSTITAFNAVCTTNPTLRGLCVPDNNGRYIWNNPQLVVLSDAEVDLYPQFSFTFNGVEYTLDGHQYLFEARQGQYQIVLLNATAGTVVAGAAFIQKYRVNFDYNTNNVGFGEATNCSTIPSCTSIYCTKESDISQCLKCNTGTYLVSNYPASNDVCSDCTLIANCATVNCTSSTTSHCLQAATGFFVVENAGTADSVVACTPVGNCTSTITCTSATDSQCETCVNGQTPVDSGPATICRNSSVSLAAGVGAILLLLIAYLV